MCIYEIYQICINILINNFIFQNVSIYFIKKTNNNLDNIFFNNVSDTFNDDGVSTFSFKLVYYLNFSTRKQYVK